MIDTHAHIDTDKFDNDRNEVIERAMEAGVKKIIIPAISFKDFDNLEKVAYSYPNVFYGVGIHPHNANEYSASVENDILNRALREKVVAIGEIGIDYYYDFSPKDTQKSVFRKQIQIAKKLNLPIIVHNREADEDILDIINSEQNGNLNGVLHCFSSSLEVMYKAIDLGFHISFTGNITFKNSLLDEVVKSVPNDKFMIETDSPYITPVPYRGKRNEPAFIKFIAERVSILKNISIEEVVKLSTENASKLFRLFILILLFSFLPIFAQDENKNTDEIVINPYKKLIGIEILGGVNTIVEGQQTAKGQQDVSFEGIPVFGGHINYVPFDFVILQAGFMQANKKQKPERDDFINSTINMFDINSIWMANPQSRVNFFLAGGISFTTLTSDKLKAIPVLDDKYDGKSTTFLTSANFGLGFNINIPISGAGLFTITGQWKLDFLINNYDTYTTNPLFKGIKDDPTPKYLKVPASAFYSIPNFGITYYPNF